MAKRATDATSKQLIARYRSARKQLAQQTERLRTGSSGDSTDKLKRGLARLEDQTAHARAELIEHWKTTNQTRSRWSVCCASSTIGLRSRECSRSATRAAP